MSLREHAPDEESEARLEVLELTDQVRERKGTLAHTPFSHPLLPHQGFMETARAAMRKTVDASARPHACRHIPAFL